MFVYNTDDVIFMLFIIIGCASLVILYFTYLVICLCEWIQKRRTHDKHTKEKYPEYLQDELIKFLIDKGVKL